VLNMSSSLSFLLASLAMMVVFPFAKANLDSDFGIMLCSGRAVITHAGEELHLSMDRKSGSGVASKSKSLWEFCCSVKLIAGNSAGTVTTVYVCINNNLCMNQLGKHPIYVSI